MVQMSIIEARVSQLGIKISSFYKPELRELSTILTDNEQIVGLVPGRYFGGYALMVATDHRLLLIDKRTFYLTVEDIHYDMISEIDFNVRLIDATLQIHTMNKQHRFTSSRYKNHLRRLTDYVQQQIIRKRHYQQRQYELDRMPAEQKVKAFLEAPTDSAPPLREVYPTRAITPPLTSSHPQIRFAPNATNFSKVGRAALAGAHHVGAHVHLPHLHMSSRGVPRQAGIFYPQTKLT
jgi:hypothetical protein